MVANIRIAAVFVAYPYGDFPKSDWHWRDIDRREKVDAQLVDWTPVRRSTKDGTPRCPVAEAP